MRKLIMIGLCAVALTACDDKASQARQVTEGSQSTEASQDVRPEMSNVIAVSRLGNEAGRTVVLVPGLASSADVWSQTVPLLEADYDVRTVQVAGFAGAQKASTEGAYTDAIAAALVKELTENPGQDTVLVGHSMGGFVSMKAALQAPELVDELVIVDSLPFLAGLFFPGATPEVAATQGPAMAEQMKAMSPETFNAQQKAGAGRLSNTADFLPTLVAWGEASDQSTVATAMGELLAADLRADLAGLEAETLVMVPWAEAMGQPRDRVAGIYEAQYAAAPNADIEIFDDSFHFIMIDQPEAFHASLMAALED